MNHDSTAGGPSRGARAAGSSPARWPGSRPSRAHTATHGRRSQATTALSRWRTAAATHASELVLAAYTLAGLVGQLCGQSLATRLVTLAALRLTLVLLGSCRRWFSTRASVPAADDSADTTGVDRVYPEAGIWTF